MKAFGFKMTAMLMCMAASVALVSCDDNNDNQPGLSHEKLIGKWNITEAKALSNEDGEWIKHTSDVEFQTDTYRDDSTVLTARTYEDGITMLSLSTWSVDAAANTLVISDQTYTVHRFKGDEMEIGYKTTDNGTDENKYGEYRWVMERMENPQPTMAERLAGSRWMYVGTEQKLDGEWVENNTDSPDVSWYEYGEDGKVRLYAKLGEMEIKNEGCWGIVNSTGAMYSWNEGAEVKSPTGVVTFVDDNTYTIAYPGSYNMATGEITKGEFRDTFVRVVNE